MSTNSQGSWISWLKSVFSTDTGYDYGKGGAFEEVEGFQCGRCDSKKVRISDAKCGFGCPPDCPGYFQIRCKKEHLSIKNKDPVPLVLSGGQAGWEDQARDLKILQSSL